MWLKGRGWSSRAQNQYSWTGREHPKDKNFGSKDLKALNKGFREKQAELGNKQH